jgi:hypothetical protein
VNPVITGIFAAIALLVTLGLGASGVQSLLKRERRAARLVFALTALGFSHPDPGSDATACRETDPIQPSYSKPCHISPFTHPGVNYAPPVEGVRYLMICHVAPPPRLERPPQGREH